MADPAKLLTPGYLHAAVTWEDARELVDKMLAETDTDALADLMERAVDSTDRAHAVIFHLVLRQRGITPRSMMEDGIG